MSWGADIVPHWHIRNCGKKYSGLFATTPHTAMRKMKYGGVMVSLPITQWGRRTAILGKVIPTRTDRDAWINFSMYIGVICWANLGKPLPVGSPGRAQNHSTNGWWKNYEPSQRHIPQWRMLIFTSTKAYLHPSYCRCFEHYNIISTPPPVR